MRRAALIVLLVAMFASHGGEGLPNAEQSSGFGSIEGTVLDSEGNPVSEASVYALFTGGPTAGMVPVARTDGGGNYALGGVQAGLNQVAAGKRDADYPDPIKDFTDPDRHFTEVTVRPGETTKDVVVRLGPKGGRLRGQVVDAKTGGPILGAQITFYRLDSGQDYMGTNRGRQGGFDILVPSGRPFGMRVSKRGYQTWNYGQDESEQRVQPVRMAPGETKELVIRLRQFESSK